MPLTPPPRDSNGLVVPHDHDGILDGDTLIRGIPAVHIQDGRVTSGAFKSSVNNDPYLGMSVDLEKLTNGYVLQPRYEGAVKFPAIVPRNEELLVGYDPVEGNTAHCGIWRTGDGGPVRMNKGKSRYLQRNCEWYLEVEGISLR